MTWVGSTKVAYTRKTQGGKTGLREGLDVATIDCIHTSTVEANEFERFHCLDNHTYADCLSGPKKIAFSTTFSLSELYTQIACRKRLLDEQQSQFV